MRPPAFFHGSLVIEREWKTAPERIFAAWAEPALKEQWFRGAPPGYWTDLRRAMDFRVGGVEIMEGRLEDFGLTALVEIRYHVIEPHSRIAFVYDFHLSGVHHSVTLASLDLTPKGDGTHVLYNEQIVFLDRQDGVEMRREVKEWQFDELGKLVLPGESPP